MSAAAKPRLAVIHDWSGDRTQWLVVDMNAAAGRADTWEAAEAIRKQIDAGDDSNAAPAWIAKSGGY